MRKQYECRFDDTSINYWTMQYTYASSKEEAQEHFDKLARNWGCKAGKARLAIKTPEMDDGR